MKSPQKIKTLIPFQLFERFQLKSFYKSFERAFEVDERGQEIF